MRNPRTGIRVAGVSHRGRGHLREGMPCQDMVLVRRLPGTKIWFAGIADGAGSARRSDLGAMLALDSTLSVLAATPLPELLTVKSGVLVDNILSSTCGAIASAAASHGEDMRAYASTLMFVLAWKHRHHLRYVAGHLGDGVIAFGAGSKLDALSLPDNGEEINTTVFTVSPEARERFRIYRGQMLSPCGFVLMSDGAGESLFERKTRKVAPACRTMLSWLDKSPRKSVEKALENAVKTMFVPRTHDDCSVALIRSLGR